VDQFHPNGNRDIQQATVNLFDDMGVRPHSLQPELVLDSLPEHSAADMEAPKISQTFRITRAPVRGSSKRDGRDQLNEDQRTTEIYLNLEGNLRQECTAKGYSNRECALITGEGGGKAADARVVVEGRAWDVGGGIVGAVEVSEDGGDSWHPTLVELPVELPGAASSYSPAATNLLAL
jgi:hypothetical protein